MGRVSLQSLVYRYGQVGEPSKGDAFFDVLDSDFELEGDGVWVSAAGIRDVLLYYRKK